MTDSGRPAARRKAPKARSALANGTALFLGKVDGRTQEGRRYADLIADLQAERGGAEALSTTQGEAIRTYAGLVLLRDTMHAQLARGEAVDDEALGQIGDRMARQAREMGRPKAPARQDLRSHIASKRRGQLAE